MTGTKIARYVTVIDAAKSPLEWEDKVLLINVLL